MDKSIFHRLAGLLWVLAIVMMVMLALYVSLGRLLMSNLSGYKDVVLAELNARYPFVIEAGAVSGNWRSFSPEIVLTDLRLSVPGGSDPPLHLAGGRVGLDVLASLRQRGPKLTQLELHGLRLKGELSSEGELRINGFGDAGGQLGLWLENFLLGLERAVFSDNKLELLLPGGEQRELALNLQMRRSGSYRHLQAHLQSRRGEHVRVLAEGVGNPFRPSKFSGELYLELDTIPLQLFEQALADYLPDTSVAGLLNAQLWFNWSRGEPQVETRVEVSELRLAGNSSAWSLPIQRLAVDAKLEARKNRWTVFASDLEIIQAHGPLQIPRMQLDVWGRAMRLRCSSFSLAPVNQLLAAVEGLPLKPAEAFATVNMRGDLRALQISIADVADVNADWSVEASFENLSVEPWRRAPGVHSASGFMELAPGEGSLILDSQDFGLLLPKVYHQPLVYDDVFGSLKFSWNARELELRSGLITADGAEGSVKALLGLRLPFELTEAGLEVELLAGLVDSAAEHRHMYIPHRLPDNLRQWIARAIVGGRVEQAGFIWRGSIMKEARALRTMQLYLNTTEGELEYHPAWPVLREADALIVVDDTNVDASVERGQLLNSQIVPTAVRAWRNAANQPLLSVKGAILGPAADGLSVVNGAVIGRYVGSAFADWRAGGTLATDLDLQINLSRLKEFPTLKLSTGLRDVDLAISPGNLAIKQVAGRLNFTSAEGLSSENLRGSLWGESVVAAVAQQPVMTAGQRRRTTPVAVKLEGVLDAANLRRWIKFEPLAFASGKTSVEIRLLAAPELRPQVEASTDLVGIALDVPAPVGKSREQIRKLQLRMPLGGNQQLLELDYAGIAAMQLTIEGGSFAGASLGLSSAPAPPQSGELHVGGALETLDARHLLKFLSDYFPSRARDLAAGGDVPGDRRPVDKMPADKAVTTTVEQLQLGRLFYGATELAGVTLNARIEPEHWKFAVQTDWLQGELQLARDDTISSLRVTELDLVALQSLDWSGGDPEAVLKLPDTDVVLEGLRWGQRPLGELSFGIRSEANNLYAEDIVGEIASMNLGGESPGRLSWRQGPGSRTDLELMLQLEDFGAVMADLGYERIMATRQGNLLLKLNWPNGPSAFSMQHTDGVIVVDLEKGQFLEAPAGASGALRVVNILNLVEIVRRLSLSHMFESGIGFDSIDGELEFSNGIINVPAMTVVGPLTGFEFSGQSDILAKSLAGELAVTLPLANNLPWVAALAAGLPVAAGVFLVSKVFEKQMNRLSSAIYSISGTWNEPIVKLDRVFDNSASGSRSQAAPETGGSED